MPTITREFGLYCDDAWKKGLLGTSLLTVGLFATLFFGWVANTYGRKPALKCIVPLGGIFCFLTGFSGNYWIMLACYSLTGFVFPLGVMLRMYL